MAWASLRITRRKAPSSWPKATTLFEMRFPPQFFEQCGGAWAGQRAAVPAKPLVVTVALVPDGARSWVGVSAEDKRLAAVLAQLTAAQGPVPCASAAQLDPLAHVRVMSGGVLSRAAVEQTMAHVGALSWRPVSEPGGSGTDSLVAWWWTAPQAAGAPVALTLRLPRDSFTRWMSVARSRRSYGW